MFPLSTRTARCRYPTIGSAIPSPVTTGGTFVSARGTTGVIVRRLCPADGLASAGTPCPADGDACTGPTPTSVRRRLAFLRRRVEDRGFRGAGR